MHDAIRDILVESSFLLETQNCTELQKLHPLEGLKNRSGTFASYSLSKRCGFLSQNFGCVLDFNKAHIFFLFPFV